MRIPWLKVHVLTDKQLEKKLEAAKTKTRELGNKRILKLTGKMVRLEMILKSLTGGEKRE